jgi:hypothetical protein
VTCNEGKLVNMQLERKGKITFIIIVTPQLSVGSLPLFSSLILYKVGRTPWTGDQPVVRPRITQKADSTYIPSVGLEPTPLVFGGRTQFTP